MTPLIILTLILICSAVSVGFYAACSFDGDEAYDQSDKEMRTNWPMPTDDQKMILWWVRYYGGRYLGKYWYKPVYGCLPCMGSLHSIYPTLLLLVYTDQLILAPFVWPIVALATCGVNKIITVWWK